MVLRGRSLLCIPIGNCRLVITHARVTEALFGRGSIPALLGGASQVSCFPPLWFYVVTRVVGTDAEREFWNIQMNRGEVRKKYVYLLVYSDTKCFVFKWLHFDKF